MNNKIKIFMFITLTTTLPTHCEGWREWFGKIFKCPKSCDVSQYSWQKIAASVGLTVAGMGILGYVLIGRSKTKPSAPTPPTSSANVVDTKNKVNGALQELLRQKKIYENNIKLDQLANDDKGLIEDSARLDDINLKIEMLQKKL